MAVIAGEQLSGGEVRDNDGRLIVVGPAGAAIGGGGGASGTVALDAATLAALETISVANLLNPHPVSVAAALDISDRTARLLGHVQVDNFPATQPVSLATNTPDVTDRDARVLGRAKIHDGTNVASVLNAAPGTDTGQSALAVRVVSQLGAGSGGGGSAGTIDAPADNVSPTLAQHVQAFLSCFDGTNWDRVRGDTTNGLDVDVTRLPSLPAGANAIGSVSVSNFPAAQAVSDGGGSLTVDGTVTANAGTGPWPVTDNGGTLSVDDGAGSLTVDGSVSVSNFPATQPVSLASVPTVTEKQDQPASTTATWTSATALNTALTNTTVTGYGTANISIQTPSTATAGAITIEVSDDGTTWYPAGAVRVDNTLAENVVQIAGPGIAQTRMYAVSVDAMTQIRVRLSTVIVGTGNTVVRIGLVAGGIEPLVATIAPRTMFALSASLPATVAAEALLSMVATRGLTAAAGATQQTVTPGKTLRITSITAGLLASTAALVYGFLVLRARSSGTVVVTDPVMWRGRLSSNSALLGGAGWLTVSFPDGLDLPSGATFAVTHAANVTSGIWDISINGYEF